MNRRKFLVMAAVGGASAASVLGGARQVEFDLTGGSPESCRENGEMEAFVRLEELYPSDPGQLSGAHLRISQACEEAHMGAWFGTHCVGYLDGAPLVDFISAATAGDGREVRALLSELYPEIDPPRLSGASLLFLAGEDPELRLCCGFGQSHCFGRVRGRNLAALLDRARRRCGIANGLERA